MAMVPPSNDTIPEFANSSLPYMGVNSTKTSSGGISRVELWFQLVVVYCFLGGLFSTAGNVAMAVGIIRSKELRTRFFVIICFLVIDRAILGVLAFALFVYRTLGLLNVIETRMKLVWCYLLSFHAYYALTLEMVLMLGLVIDRTLAMVKWKYYRTLTYKQAVHACVLASAVTIFLKLLPSLVTVDFGRIVVCTTIYSAATPAMITYHETGDLILWFLILVVYVGLICHVRYRFTPMMIATGLSGAGDQSEMKFFKKQAKLLPMLKRLVLMHCGLAMAGKVAVWMSEFMPQWIGSRFVAYAGMAGLVDISANVVMLLASHKSLREAAFPCFFKRTSAGSQFRSSSQQQAASNGRRS